MLMFFVFSHQKEIYSLFELQHKLEVPLVFAVSSDPIPTMLVACMLKTGISYVNA